MKEISLNVYFMIIDLISESRLSKTEAYIFGSYSKLVYKEDSDVDVAILDGLSKKDFLNKLKNKLEKRYKKRLEFHYFDKNQFYKSRKDPLVKEIIKNGMRLI